MTRETVGAEAVRVLADNPERRKPADCAWLAHRLLERVRDTRPVAADLGRPEIPSALALLSDVCRKLIHAGGLLASLHEKRRALEATIVAVERMCAAGPPASTTTSDPSSEAPKGLKARAARMLGSASS